jgi:uncharacterized protein
VRPRSASGIRNSFRRNEYVDPEHRPRVSVLAEAFRAAGHFQLDTKRMDLLVTACRIYNGGSPQSKPTLAVRPYADRLDLGRVGITPDPQLLSKATAKDIATRRAWWELELPGKGKNII